MMMPPPFVPVRTPEDNKSPHSSISELVDSPKQKSGKVVPPLAKAKSPTENNKPLLQNTVSGNKSPLGSKSVVVQQQQQQQLQQHQQQQPTISVIRPQSATSQAVSSQNGFSKVDTARVASAASNVVLERRHIITNPKLEIERMQNIYNGMSK